jgi:hypothetical protein
MTYLNGYAVSVLADSTPGNGSIWSRLLEGVPTGLTNGAFRLPWGQQIALNYTSVPTWTWFCE